jgi:UDP-N-acetylmuramyl pentapeptide phosphotransferase/UDP-N-acetylglucosamine-1-phosphate transferase
MIPVVLVLAVLALLVSPRLQAWSGLSPIDPVAWVAWGGALAAVAAAFALGLWSDFARPPAAARLAGQLAIAIIPAAVGLRVEEITLPYLPVMELPAWLGASLAVAWMLLAMHAMSAMDGAVGIAGRTAQVIGLFYLAMGFNASWRFEFMLLGAVLLGAGTGFMDWSLPRARLFAGRSGVLALGALAGVAALLLHHNDLHRSSLPLHDAFLGGVVLLAPLLLDALLSLARRALRRAPLVGEQRDQLHERDRLHQCVLLASGGDHSAACWHVEKALYLSALGAYFVVNPHGGTSNLLAAVGYVIVALGLAFYAAEGLRAGRVAGARA